MSEITKTTTPEVSPKTEKKVTAKKVTPVVSETAKTSVEVAKKTTTKVTSAVSDAAKSSIDAVKDATSATTDSVKDVYTSLETVVVDARVSGNARAKKILAAFFDDNVNKTVNNAFGHIGGATSICSVVMCAPMTVSYDGINTLYKKITA